MPMRWLMLVFLVSLAALLIAFGGLAHHIWRERNKRLRKARLPESETETEEAHEP